MIAFLTHGDSRLSQGFCKSQGLLHQAGVDRARMCLADAGAGSEARRARGRNAIPAGCVSNLYYSIKPQVDVPNAPIGMGARNPDNPPDTHIIRGNCRDHYMVLAVSPRAPSRSDGARTRNRNPL